MSEEDSCQAADGGVHNTICCSSVHFEAFVKTMLILAHHSFYNEHCVVTFVDLCDSNRYIMHKSDRSDYIPI